MKSMRLMLWLCVIVLVSPLRNPMEVYCWFIKALSVHLIWEWCQDELNVKDILERWRSICAELAWKQWPEFMYTYMLYNQKLKKTHGLSLLPIPNVGFTGSDPPYMFHLQLASPSSFKCEDDNQQKDQLWCGIELTLWNKHDIEKQCVL